MKFRFFRVLTTLLLLLFALVSIGTAQQSPRPVVLRKAPSEKSRDNKLEQAIARSLGGSDSENPVYYYYNRVDLSGDGRAEVLVYVFGRSVCGTGGCVALVFQAERNDYKLISEIGPARNPILVSQSRSHGWKDLIMLVEGGGVQPGYYAVLEFDGQQYPQNPTVPPAKRLKYRVKGTAFVNGSGNPGTGINVRATKK